MLLENPVAMRLKKAGFIEGRRFVRQPDEVDLAKAAEKTSFLDSVFGGILSGSQVDDSSSLAPPLASSPREDAAPAEEAILDAPVVLDDSVEATD